MNTVVHPHGNIVSGALWILGLSILLFWLPVVGPLLAGFVGGKKSGGVAHGIVAVFLPAMLVGAFFFMFGTLLTGLPLIGFIAGTGSFLATGSGVGMLLVGAIIGGVCAEN